jgi:predicted regulator of Ras-like GTPase activity (Roadblock/LC7/MglB family)
MEDEDRGPRRLVFIKEDIERITKLLNTFLTSAKARSVLLVDKDGHFITREGEGKSYDADTLSALVAGSFEAMKQMARQLGEKGFSIHLHQGPRDYILLSLVGERTILAVVFTDQTTLGMVRLYASQLASKLSALFEEIADRRRKGPDPFDNSGSTPLPA